VQNIGDTNNNASKAEEKEDFPTNLATTLDKVKKSSSKENEKALYVIINLMEVLSEILKNKEINNETRAQKLKEEIKKIQEWLVDPYYINSLSIVLKEDVSRVLVLAEEHISVLLKTANVVQVKEKVDITLDNIPASSSPNNEKVKLYFYQFTDGTFLCLYNRGGNLTVGFAKGEDYEDVPNIEPQLNLETLSMFSYGKVSIKQCDPKFAELVLGSDTVTDQDVKDRAKSKFAEVMLKVKKPNEELKNAALPPVVHFIVKRKDSLLNVFENLDGFAASSEKFVELKKLLAKRPKTMSQVKYESIINKLNEFNNKVVGINKLCVDMPNKEISPEKYSVCRKNLLLRKSELIALKKELESMVLTVPQRITLAVITFIGAVIGALFGAKVGLLGGLAGVAIGGLAGFAAGAGIANQITKFGLLRLNPLYKKTLDLTEAASEVIDSKVKGIKKDS